MSSFTKTLETENGGTLYVQGVRGAPLVTTRFGDLLTMFLSAEDARAFGTALLDAVDMAESSAEEGK